MKKFLLYALFIFTVNKDFDFTAFISSCSAGGIQIGKKNKDDTNSTVKGMAWLSAMDHKLNVVLFEDDDASHGHLPAVNFSYDVYLSTLTPACNANNPGGPCQ